jgi:NAD(P)-dependent dehydrogenase (short-subunit alcohol dehydrogenase family)
MDLQLTGKRALVTGSSSGLGAETARRLAAEGCLVVVHGRHRRRTEETAETIAQAGGKVEVAIGDLEKDEDAARVAEEAAAPFGGIDILINNAGLSIRPDNPEWSTVPTSDWLRSFNLNVVAAVRMSQKLAPAMCERGWGRIVNFTSVAGYQSLGMLSDYGAAKAGVHNFTVNLSRILGPKGVTVNTIAPGRFTTGGVLKNIEARVGKPGWGETREDALRLFESRVAPQPIQRSGRAEEIAAAVAVIVSPLSGYTTGSLLRIDGGISKAL